MTKGLVLTRRVDIKGWRVIGFVARAGERKELESVLLRARETGGTNAGDIAEHLLFAESLLVVAERLLRIGEVLCLLEVKEGKYILTEEGEAAIETGKVFVQEHGAWSLWVSGDYLLASPVLRVDAWEETEDAVSESRNGREIERSLEKLPDWVRNIEAIDVVPPAAGNGVAICIDELEETAEAVDADAALHLVWNVQERQLRLQGEWDGEPVGSSLEAPEMAPDTVWEALLNSEGLLEDWDRGRRVLRVSFGATSESERKSMSRDLEFRQPSVPGYGEFESVTVPGTAIAASSREDARQWSAWRLNRQVSNYATSQRYDEWWKEASEPFVEYSPDRPARAELAALEWDSVGGRPAPLAWHLAAVEDWGL